MKFTEVKKMKKIGLLYGGKSAEHEVSLSTARAVVGALNFNQYEVYPVYITIDGEWLTGPRITTPVNTVEELQFTASNRPNNISQFIDAHEKLQFDVVFPLLHGTNGEDGTVQGLLEVLNIPYVGNGVLASSAGMDKVVMKQLFEVAGLNQTPYVHFIRSEWEQDNQSVLDACEKLIYPLFVKPANLGSSVGINRATNRDELSEAIEVALRYDRKIIGEQGVIRREIEMALLGNEHPKTSVVGEIKPLTEFYDYDSKYKDNTTELIIPAQVTDEVLEKMKETAIRAFKILDLSGLVRADFFVTEDNEVIINEVNTMPGFTPVSMYPMLWQKSGLSYPELIDKLIDLAIERFNEKQKLQYNK